MTAALPPPRGETRFPGQHALDERGHWDEATADLVAARVGEPPALAFFSDAEGAAAAALLDQLVGQEGHEGHVKIALVNAVDARLAARETDGWHYADLPEDRETWRRTVAQLDDDARERCGLRFADAAPEQQAAILRQIHGLDTWHGLPAGHLWNLWMRYACTAFYAHPSAWDEIGFPGPAYPRGYANLGTDRREHFEVRDAFPGESA